MNKFTYTNAKKDSMMSKVINIAESITNETWESDGAYAINSSCTMSINVYDFMDILTFYYENGKLEQYVKSIIDENNLIN